MTDERAVQPPHESAITPAEFRAEAARLTRQLDAIQSRGVELRAEIKGLEVRRQAIEDRLQKLCT